jgi:uncharacterized protein YprB with RNaseH-like and TPR domain
MSLRRRLRRLERREERRPAAIGALRDIPGLDSREVVRQEGAFLVHDETFALDHLHGRHRLVEACAIRPEAVSLVALDERIADAWRPEGAVFLDTETTGLSGGAGTYVFLVGAGWFEGEVFRLRQYYMRDHREERAMLAALNDDLARFDVLVTFHGKSFDAPRIRDRMRALHLEPRLPGERHLDLCVVGRRLWRGKHADGRLQTLEAQECGFHRKHDLPGAECPEAWFAYLRGDGRVMARVFEHNRDDILSLVVLAARTAQAGEGGGDAHERLVVAKLLARTRRREEAETRLRDLLDTGVGGPVRTEALRELAVLLRHRGETEGAAACWTELREEDPMDPVPMVEIAKHLEHRRRDVAGALDLTEEALRSAGGDRPTLREELEHRRRRLLRKASHEG